MDGAGAGVEVGEWYGVVGLQYSALDELMEHHV